MEDHALRYALANELHARPFPSIQAPARAVHLAIKQPTMAAARDRELDRAHLIDLLDRFGAQHPGPGATHFFGQVGKHLLKWESHTEFVTYTLFSEGVSARPFDPSAFDAFPQDWLDKAPGVRVTSVLIRIEEAPVSDHDAIDARVNDWFVAESVAVSTVIEGAAAVAADFRIDTNGHTRMAVFVAPGTGANRIGRIVQRLCEIETYKSMSMLGLAMAREISVDMNAIENALSQLVGDMRREQSREETLNGLLDIAARLESLSTRSNFRFGATGAYEALVTQRVDALREARFQGRQTFGEFMMRRYDPAMRTVKSAERRLSQMTERATRAGDLLRTQVDVERSAQNQKLLESMDRRAHLQLRLQETVEGLSVVAISYYAINLAYYMLDPLGKAVGLDKSVTVALVTPLVILAVWVMVHRIRKSME
ncbi:MAG: DUF3422 domain-containing protein [Mangrovicoccus sp.]|nr:DUF3422 domain-containing protein [Mangrovicoccus sp.]